MKPLLIVNPASCGGRTAKLFPELRRPIAHWLGEVDVVETQRPGHATELARAAALDGRERIVAVGGDGTFSEVTAGVLDAGAPAAVGILHQGTGGDFRRTLGLEHRPDRYLEAVAKNAPRAVDAGRVTHRDRQGNETQRWFVNVLSVGMGGLVDQEVAKPNRLIGGSALYFAASVKSLVTGAVGRVVCDVEYAGERRTEHLETRMLAVCNGRYFGGGMEVAPMAQPDDGAFDVVVIGGEHRLPVLAASAAIYRGEHLKMRGVQHFKANRIALRLVNTDDTERFPLDVDGEAAGTVPVSIEVVPKALRVLA